MNEDKAVSLSEKRATLMMLWREFGEAPKSGRVLLPQTAAAVAERLRNQSRHIAKTKKPAAQEYPEIDPASDEFRL